MAVSSMSYSLKISLLIGLIVILVVVLPASVYADNQQTAKLQARVFVAQMLDLQIEPETIAFSAEDILTGTLDTENRNYVVVKEASADNPDFVFRAASIGNVAHSVSIEGLPARDADNTILAYGMLSEMGDTLPWDQLEWRFSPQFHPHADPEDWRPLSSERHVLYSGPAYQETAVHLDFRLTVYFTDPMGAYQGTMQFTLSPVD